ncbi:MAG: hypothetical protein COB07_12130 [Sulfurovum sp.]|nr:MAG: hypothetical protein COB07_12130 [Sulfurovum sp.]
MTTKTFFLLFMLTFFLHSEESISFTQEEQNYLKEKKEIKLCFSPKGLPLFGYKEGQYIGILPEVMHLIERNIPIPFHYINVKTWEECINLSKDKKVDMAGVIITKPNLHTHLTASTKLMEAFIGIATKIKEPFFNELNNLEGKKIAFLKGQVSVKHYVMQKFPKIQSVMVDSIEEGLGKIAKGEVYGYADDTYTLAYHILNLYSNELKIIERVNETPISGSIGVLKDDVILLNIVNKAIGNIDEQDIRDIIHDWITVRVLRGFDYQLFVQIFLIFLLLFLVSVYWIRRLSKEVHRRKFAEKKLKSLNDTLENEISMQVQELYHKDVMLQEKTKLAAMGEMLGSIAHQWRRPLSSLHINIELLETEYDEKKINTKFLKLFIEKNSAIIQYMSQTIDDFQSFYQLDKEKVLYDVFEKVKSLTRLHTQYLVEDNIELQIEGERMYTNGYPSEFQQVILNVINNAHDAHKANKSVKPFIHIHIFAKNTQIIVEIRDNAGGIDAGILGKIFEANFTTKTSSKNTGLGLYISKMIIENNMQGKLSVSNTLNGCCVEIQLKREGNE